MGPHLTPKQRAKLEAEIREFDVKRTKALIEKNAVGKRDVNAYHDWVEENGGVEPLAANPDNYIVEEMQTQLSGVDFELLNAKMEVNEILSFRQRQVWAYRMRQGLSNEETAARLNISPRTAESYLKAAIKKVRQHFLEKR